MCTQVGRGFCVCGGHIPSYPTADFPRHTDTHTATHTHTDTHPRVRRHTHSDTHSISDSVTHTQRQTDTHTHTDRHTCPEHMTCRHSRPGRLAQQHKNPVLGHVLRRFLKAVPFQRSEHRHESPGYALGNQTKYNPTTTNRRHPSAHVSAQRVCLQPWQVLLCLIAVFVF